MRDGDSVSGRLPTAIPTRRADIPDGDSHRGVEDPLDLRLLTTDLVATIVCFVVEG